MDAVSTVASIFSVISNIITAVSPGLLSAVETISAIDAQSRVYIQLYGRVGALLPLLCSSDAWQLVKKTLETDDDEILLNFVSAQIAQANMVAVTVGRLSDQVLKISDHGVF